MVLGKNSYVQNNQTGLLIPCTKINSKWIKDLNIGPETIKLREENIGVLSLTLVLVIFFLDMSPWAGENKAKINKWHYIKLKSFCTVKEAINKIKRPPTEWEKIFASDISDKGLISKIDKSSYNSMSKNPNNWIKKNGQI